MRSESRAGIVALFALVSSGNAFAQARCDCTRIVDSCQATATVQNDFIEVTSDAAACSRVDYLVDGIPLVALVVDGTERQEWIAESETPSVIVESCQVCQEVVRGSEASFGGPGLYTEGEVTSLIEVSPVYPPEALAAGTEGFVELRFEVDLDGTVGSPEIVAAEPEGVFNEAALDAIRQWRYTYPVDEPQTVTERIEFTLAEGVLSLRPAPTEAASRAAVSKPLGNSCIQERMRFDFGATIDISLINACEEPLLVYNCSSGTGTFSNRWICNNPERSGTIIGSARAAQGQTVRSPDGTEAFSSVGRLEITRAPNGEYWLLACSVDDLACRSDGREWVRSLDRQVAAIDPQARTRARLARSY